MPWPVYVLFFALAAIPVLVLLSLQIRTSRLLTRAGLSDVKRMAAGDFTRYLSTLLSGLGYQVERVDARAEYGVDLILIDGTGRRTAVHARQFQQPVDRDGVREVQEGADHHDCQDAMLVTTVRFTRSAIAMAEEVGAILWDLGDLADAMDKVRERPSFQGTLPVGREVAASSFSGGLLSAAAPARSSATSSEWPSTPAPEFEASVPQTPPCPICGIPMVARQAAGKHIWLCTRFPRCTGASVRGQ